jgi:ferric-dicitrate binding protein FerR (iron transport regulator)
MAGVMSRTGLQLMALTLVSAGVGMAQKVISAKAGLVYFVLGRVSIAGSGQLPHGDVNRQLNEGEILSSEAGRAEVLLNPGTVLRIGNMTRIRIDNGELTNTRVSIEAGSAVVTVNQLPKLDRVEIHIGGKVVVMDGVGVYRFDADRRDTAAARLRVFSGQVLVYREEGKSRENGAWKTVAKRGQAVRLQDLQVGKFDRKDADALEQWAEERGTPPVIQMRPMVCYLEPINLAGWKEYMRDCLHLPAETK